MEKIPYNDISIRNNSRKHNTLNIGEVRRETAVERHKVLNKWQKGKHTSNIFNLDDEKEANITKNSRKSLKLAIVEGNQAPSLQEANEFDKISRLNEFKVFGHKNNVVAEKLEKYLKGDIENLHTIDKFKRIAKVSNLNKKYPLNYDYEDNRRIHENKKMKFIINPKKSLNHSKKWNFLDEVNNYQQPNNEKATIFNHVKIIRNKDQSYLDRSTIKTELLGTTFARKRFEWKFINKSTTHHEINKKRKSIHSGLKRQNLIIPNFRLNNENSHSDISVNDTMEAEHSLRYHENSFINSKTPKPISLLINIIPSFKNAHASKIFNSKDNNGSSSLTSITVTPSKFAGKSTYEFVNRNSFNLKQTPSNPSGSVLSYNDVRTKINVPVGKKVTAKPNKNKHSKKKKIKSIAKDINDFTREPSKIAKYKKRLHPKLSDLNELLKKNSISSTYSDEDIIKNLLDSSFKHATWSDQEIENNLRKPRIYSNTTVNRHTVDTRLSPHPTKKRLLQDNVLFRSATPVQRIDNVNLLPALTLKFTDPRKIPSLKKKSEEETVTVTNIKEVLFNYLEKLTNMKSLLKVEPLKYDFEMSTIKVLDQNEFEVSTFTKPQKLATDEILPTKPNVRRSELATVYKDIVAELPPKYRPLKYISLTETSKPVSEHKIISDSIKPSNIMRLKKYTENHETHPSALKTVENLFLFEPILKKILNFKNSTYNTPMLKKKVKALELLLTNSRIKYLNVSESVTKDITKSSSTTFPRPVFIESLKYPSVFDVYPNLGRWQPSLELGSGVPTIVTNVSNDLTNKKMPSVRHWNTVIPPNEPAFHNEDMYSEKMLRSSYIEKPINIKLKQTEKDKKNQFRYDSKPYIERMRKPLQDMYRVNTTALAIRSDNLRQKARKKFLKEIEDVRNQDLIRILFSTPYINQHLKVKPSPKKQPSDVFNRDMYSVLPLNVANYQKYKKEDRPSQRTNVFLPRNYYNRPRWVLPIGYKNKFHDELQSIDSTSPFDKLENDFVNGTIRPETIVFPEMHVEDIMSDLENTENKLQSDISAHEKLDTNIYNKSMYGTRREQVTVKHSLPTGRIDEIENLRNEDILSNFVKTYKKNSTNTELTLAQLNNELLLSTESFAEGLEDKDVPILDEGLRPIDKLTNDTKKPNTESDDLAHYIEDIESDYELAKTKIITIRPKYSTVKSRKFSMFKTHSSREEEIDEKNMETSYSKPLNASNDEYLDSVPSYETTPIEDLKNVFLSTSLTAPFEGKDDYYLPTTSVSSAIMNYATLPIRNNEVGLSLSKDLEDQETPIIDKNLRPGQTFWKPKVFATTVRPITKNIFDKLLISKQKSPNNTEKLSTESEDLTNYIEDLEKDHEPAKTHLITFRPKYSTVKPRKFPISETHTREEEFDEKNMKTSYPKPINATRIEYSDSVPTYETAPIEDNMFLSTSLVAPPQGNYHYYVTKSRKPTTSDFSRIMTYATLPIKDDEVDSSISNDLEDNETSIIDKDLRPIQKFLKPIAARTTTETFFTYPTQALQENDEMVLKMSSKPIYEMESEPIPKINENQEDALYERYSNNLIDNGVTVSTYATLSLQEDSADSPMMEKQNSFIFKDSRKGYTTTYLPNYRAVVTLRGKKKEEGGFMETFQDLNEVTTANLQVSYRPSLAYDDKNEETITKIIVDQDNEYKSAAPTFLHRTVPRQNLTRILPIFKNVGLTTNSTSYIYSNDERYKWKAILANLSNNPILTTHETIFKPHLYNIPKENYDYSLEKPILGNQATLKPKDVSLLEHMKKELKKPMSMTTPYPKPTLTYHKMSYENVTKSGILATVRKWFTEDEGDKYDNSIYTKSTTTRPTDSPYVTLTRHNSLVTMMAKDVHAQSPMIDIGLRPVEDKWKPLSIYGKDKFLKKEQNYLKKIKDYDEKFLNDKSTNELDCKEKKCKSTTVIRPTNTYTLKYRNTTMNNWMLTNFDTIDKENPGFDILSNYKVSSYTETDQDENIFQETPPFEFVTLTTVHKNALNKFDDPSKVNLTDVLTVGRIPGLNNYTKHVLDETIEYPTENDRHPDIKLASNVSPIFTGKTSDDKIDTELVSKMFPENTQRRIENDSSSDKKLVSEFPRKPTIPPFNKAYSVTRKFKNDKYKNKFNLDFWKPKFFPNKIFTSIKPTKYSSRTSFVQENYEDKKKNKGYPTIIDMKEKNSIAKATKHWTDYVQRVDEGTLTQITTKYIQKPTITSPRVFARIEYQSTSPIKSNKKPKLLLPGKHAPIVEQKFRNLKPLIYPHNIYTTLPILLPENVSRRPSFSKTTIHLPIRPIKKTYNIAQDKQKVNVSVEYTYAPILKAENYSKNPLTTENVFNKHETGAYPIVHSNTIGDSKGVIPTKSIYTTVLEDHNISNETDWKPKLFNLYQNIPIPIHSYSFKPEYVNVTMIKESNRNAQGSPNTIPTQEAYNVSKISTLTSTNRPFSIFIPYAIYPISTYLSTKAPNFYTPEFEGFIKTHDYKHPDKSVFPDRYPDKLRYPAKDKYPNENRYYPNNEGKYFDKERYPEKGTYYDKDRYPDEDKLSDKDIYPDTNRYPYLDKYPDNDKDRHKNFKYPGENQDQYPKPFLMPTVKGYDQYNKNNGVYEYTNETVISSRPLPGGESEDRYPVNDMYHGSNKYSKNITYLDKDRYQDKKKNLIKNKYPDKNKYGKYVDNDRYPDNDEYSDKERYFDKDKYYKYPPTVDEHTARHTPRLPSNEDKDKYDSFGTYSQEEKYYDQNYDHKFNYGYKHTYAPARGKTHDTFAPKRLPNYKNKYPDNYDTYSDVKYPDKTKYYEDEYSKPHGIPTIKDFDQYNENSGLYEDSNKLILSPRPLPSGKNGAKYPNKDVYTNKEKYRHKDNYPNNHVKYPYKNKFYQVQHFRPLEKPTMKYHDQYDKKTKPYEFTDETIISFSPSYGDQNKFKYPDRDNYPDKNKYPDKEKHDDRYKDYRDHALHYVPTYSDLYNSGKYPYLFDVVTRTSVFAKPPALKTIPVHVDYGYDLIPGGISKSHFEDHRPKVPSLSDSSITVKYEENPTSKPPIVLGPGEKDATPTVGSELPEINYENKSTLPYQPELPKLSNLIQDIKQAPHSTSKDKIPNFDNYKSVQEDKKPQLICGKDNSPISIVYEGAAKIESYPWFGVLVYPRGG